MQTCCCRLYQELKKGAKKKIPHLQQYFGLKIYNRNIVKREILVSIFYVIPHPYVIAPHFQQLDKFSLFVPSAFLFRE